MKISFHTGFGLFLQSGFFDFRFVPWEAILNLGLGVFRRKDISYAVSASCMDSFSWEKDHIPLERRLSVLFPEDHKSCLRFSMRLPVSTESG